MFSGTIFIPFSLYQISLNILKHGNCIVPKDILEYNVLVVLSFHSKYFGSAVEVQKGFNKSHTIIKKPCLDPLPLCEKIIRVLPLFERLWA